MNYIEKHLTACLEDKNLLIYVDKENALKSCVSEDGIQMFYIEEGKELPLKLGSNNITQEYIKENLNFKITNKVGNGKKEFQRNTEKCAKQSSMSPVTKAANTSLAIGVVFGSIGILVVAVICCSVYRRRMKKNDKVVDENVKDDSGKEDEAKVTQNERYWKFSDNEDYYEDQQQNVLTDRNEYYEKNN